MINSLKFLSVSASLLVATISITHAQTLGINFQGGGGALLSSDVAGVLPQANFNNETGQSGTATGLLDSTGAATGIGVTYGAQGTFGAANNEDKTDQFTNPPDKTLMDGYLDVQAQTNGVVTLTGLTPGSTHDLYLYTLPSVVGRGGSFDVNGGAPQTETAATSTTYVAGTNYLLFPGVTADANGKLTINADTSLSTNIYREAIQGVEITGVGAVPEPASLAAIAGLAALGLGFRRRRS